MKTIVRTRAWTEGTQSRFMMSRACEDSMMSDHDWVFGLKGLDRRRAVPRRGEPVLHVSLYDGVAIRDYTDSFAGFERFGQDSRSGTLVSTRNQPVYAAGNRTWPPLSTCGRLFACCNHPGPWTHLTRAEAKAGQPPALTVSSPSPLHLSR